MRIWFADWQVSGSRVSAHPERALGPIMFAMHTLSKGTLKVNAIIAPVETAGQEAALEVQTGGWKQVATAPLDPEARTATFRVPNWDDTVDTPYRVLFRRPQLGRNDPPRIRLAATKSSWPPSRATTTSASHTLTSCGTCRFTSPT